MVNIKKSALIAIVLTVLVVTALLAVAFADVTIGVKKGDWIEYQVTVTGNPVARYEITWASINVTGIHGQNIDLYIQSRFTNQSLLIENITVNLETRPGDSFVIPSNLNVGDEFYNPSVGNITISGEEQQAVLGAERTVVSAVTKYTTYYWDRQTGILVQATTTAPVGLNTGFGISQGFTVHSKTSGTNMWQPQILGLNYGVFYALIISIVAVVASVGVAAILVWRKRTPSRTGTFAAFSTFLTSQ